MEDKTPAIPTIVVTRNYFETIRAIRVAEEAREDKLIQALWARHNHTADTHNQKIVESVAPRTTTGLH